MSPRVSPSQVIYRLLILRPKLLCSVQSRLEPSPPKHVAPRRSLGFLVSLTSFSPLDTVLCLEGLEATFGPSAFCFLEATGFLWLPLAFGKPLVSTGSIPLVALPLPVASCSPVLGLLKILASGVPVACLASFWFCGFPFWGLLFCGLPLLVVCLVVPLVAGNPSGWGNRPPLGFLSGSVVQ